MTEMKLGTRKKLPQMRRLSSLGSIRREIIRVYEEARNKGADPVLTQYYRGLTFILSSAAAVMKDEKLEDIEARLEALEKGSNRV
jgi:hypothetical protein